LRRLYFLCCAVGLAAVMVGCNQRRAGPPDRPPPEVSVVRPVVTPVQRYFEYNGNLEAVEAVQITARVKGFLNEVLFTEGAEVQANDLLFKIDPREYAAAVRIAEADRRKAAAEVKRTRADFDRARSLRGTGAISAEELEQRLAAYETAEAVVAQTDAALDARRLDLSFTEIRSPIAGQISRTLITKGNLVGQSGETPLTSVVTMHPLFVYFDVPERDLVEYQRSLRAGDDAAVLSGALPVEIGVATEDGFPHKGKIDFRENRVDQGTGTVRIRGQIPNEPLTKGAARVLYPGLFARVRVPSGAAQPLPAIPEDALMTNQEGRFVYVLGDGNVAKARKVVVGPHVYKAAGPAGEGPPRWTVTDPKGKPDPAPSVVAIESGLTAEDRVIFKGLTKVRPDSPVDPQAWELKPPADAAAK